MAGKEKRDGKPNQQGADNVRGPRAAKADKSGAQKSEKPDKAASGKNKPAKAAKPEKTRKARDPEAPARLARTARRLLLPAMVLLVVAIAAFWFVIDRIGSDPRIAAGVTLEGIPVGGLSPESLDAFLTENCPDPPGEAVLTLTSENWRTTVTFGELGLAVDRDALRTSLLAPGHEGGALHRLLARLSLRKSPLDVKIPIRFEPAKVDELLQAACEAIDRPATGARLEMSKDAVTLTTGTDGVAVDVPKLAARIQSVFNTRKAGSVFVPVMRVRSPALDAVVLAKAINRAPVNASRGTDADGRGIILPSARGRRIEVSVLAAIIDKLEARTDRNAVTRTLPVVFSEPSVTAEDLTSSAGRTGGSFVTSVPLEGDTNGNRATNIGLAAAALDRIVIPAGGEFSFNDATGPRTAASGYVTAPVYADGRVISAIGGGVCQVSTTLLNALLEAGLEPLERHPHTFTVAYAAPGRDAAVSFGQIDLRMRNPHPFPVTIRTRLEGPCLRADVLFPPDAHAATIRLYTRVLDTEPAASDIIEDGSLPRGSQRVLEPGVEGMSVETWLQCYEGGNLISERKLFDSRYRPYTARILTGTGSRSIAADTGNLAVLPDHPADADGTAPIAGMSGLRLPDVG